MFQLKKLGSITFAHYSTFLIMCIPFAGSFGSFGSDFLISLISLSFLIFLFKKKKYEYFFNKYVLIFTIFWLVLVINSFFSINPKVSLQSSFFFIRFLFFSLCIWYLCSNHKIFFKKIYSSIYALFLILFFFGAIEIITGYNIFDINLQILSEILNGKFIQTNERISIFFYDEKILGGFLLRWIILFTALFFYIYNQSNLREFYKFIIVFFLTSVLIFSAGERSTVFLYFLFIVMSFLILKINFKKKIILVLSIITIFISLIQAVPELKRRLFVHVFEYGFKQGGEWRFFSIQHEAHYMSALKIFVNNPYFGSGVKTFRFECKKNENKIEISKFNITGCATHPHNTYMQLLAETGIFGFLYIFSFFFLCCVKLFRDVLNNFSNNNTEINYCKSFLFIHFFVFLWPIIPTGSFFHNWTFAGYIFPLGFLIFFIEKNFLNKK